MCLYAVRKIISLPIVSDTAASPERFLFLVGLLFRPQADSSFFSWSAPAGLGLFFYIGSRVGALEWEEYMGIGD